MTTDNQNGEFVPDATVANIDFGAAASIALPGNETFSSAPLSSADAYATRVPNPVVDVAVQNAPRPVAQVGGQKKSKAVWAVGALVVLFAMGIAAAGAGWFVYSKYYASAAVALTPEPTFEITPTPEPTLEAITNSNSDSTVQLDANTSNTNTEVPTVEPTPATQPETATKETIPSSKQTQQVEAKKTTPAKTNTPVAAKPTPKKSDRTVILQ